MRLLLDTHLLLWAAGKPEKLPPLAQSMLLDTDNELVFSSASIWEIIIRSGIGRDDFRVEASVLRRALLDGGYDELPISGRHALAVGALPPLHKDPFDRILIAQAVVEGIVLLTTDEAVSLYPGPIRKV